MTRAHIVARRKKAAEQAIQKRWRQNYIEENLSKPGKYEGVYKQPKLIVRRVRR